MVQEEIAIIGAGQAAAALAARLRENGCDGRITLYGAEPHPPYQRPPLSKRYIAERWPEDRLAFKTPEAWRALNVDLALGERVTSVDPAARTLTVCGATRSWTKLALTTGAAPRRPPGALRDLEGVYVLGDLADANRLALELKPGRTLLVIGGGYIGLEVAATSVQLGLRVVMVEQAPRILSRVASAETAARLRALHCARGVTLHEGRRIAGVFGAPRVEAVELDDGTRIQTDLVVVGIGAEPRTKLAEAAGLACADGVLVDEYGRSSAPSVWAAGDCANFPLNGLRTRLESVQNAVDQAECVADDMTGRGRPYRPTPWFWSDQYDMKLQIVGLSRGAETLVVKRSARGESVWYFRDGQMIAVDALNDARAYMAAKKLLEAGRVVCKAEVERADFDPAALLKKRPDLIGADLRPDRRR